MLYFSGNDGVTGFELWRYNPAACLTPSTVTALQGSRVCAGSFATVTISYCTTSLVTKGLGGPCTCTMYTPRGRPASDRS